MNLNEIIHASPLFFEIEDKEIDFIMKQCKIKECKKDAHVFAEGDRTDQLYLVLDGKILVHKNTKGGRIRLDELETGDIFGVSVFSEEKTREHNAIALIESYILEIDYSTLELLYSKKPKLFGIIMLNISRLLAKRLSKANSAMFNIAELTQNMVAGEEGPEVVAKKPLIYVIEDDADVRGVVVAYLEDHFEIQSFENPLEVIELVSAGKLPDAFVTDFMMPEMTGIEFTEFLKEEKVDKPVVFVTGVNQFNMAMGALNLGVFSLIEKPFTPDQIVHTVKGALRERFLIDFNSQLLGQYSSLFTSLSRIMQSLDSQSFVNNLKQLIAETQTEYQKINERKKLLSLL